MSKALVSNEWLIITWFGWTKPLFFVTLYCGWLEVGCGPFDFELRYKK